MDSYSCASGNGCHDYQITIQNYNGHRSYCKKLTCEYCITRSGLKLN